MQAALKCKHRFNKLKSSMTTMNTQANIKSLSLQEHSSKSKKEKKKKKKKFSSTQKKRRKFCMGTTLQRSMQGNKTELS